MIPDTWFVFGVLAAAGFLLHDDEEIDFSEMASDAP